MLNQVIIVGRLVDAPKKVESENGASKNIFTLACQRSYKNVDGTYDTDFFDITTWGMVAEQTTEYCKKGDVIGIRGRLQTRMVDDTKHTEIIAERVTFLSSNNITKDDSIE